MASKDLPPPNSELPESATSASGSTKSPSQEDLVEIETGKPLEEYEVAWMYIQEDSVIVDPTTTTPASSIPAPTASSASSASSSASSPSTSSAAFPSSSAAPAATPAAAPAAKQASDWKPFTMTDSLKLECAFRGISATPGSAASSVVSVMNDVYDVNVVDRIGTPVYWRGPTLRVMRATWFINKEPPVPLDEDVAQEIEDLYLGKAWANALPYKKELSQGNSATVFSQNEIKFYPNSITTRFSVFVKGGDKAGLPLVRGPLDTKRIPCDSIEVNNFSHLVFVVHGIGQRMEEFDILTEVTVFRKTLNKLSYSFFPQDMVNNGIQVIPVQWRKDIELSCDGNGDNVTLDDVTLETLQMARRVLNGTFVDVLIYMTPSHRDRIHVHVVSKMKALFDKFISRNPDFIAKGGQVSIVGFSLGSVISFDILTRHSESLYAKTAFSEAKPDVNDPPEVAELKIKMFELEAQIAAARKKHAEDQFGLNFEVANYFMFGSPVGIFLTLRGDIIHSDGIQGLYPKCRKMFNVFHPYDPIAYRVEPLVDRRMAKNKPAYVPDFKGGNKFHIEMQSRKEEMYQKTEEVRKVIFQSWSSLTNVFSGSKAASKPQVKEEENKETPKVEKKKEDPPGEISEIFQNLGDGRIDYVLQDEFLENPLTGAATSHLSYWKSDDTVMFFLRKVYGKEGVEVTEPQQAK